MSTIKEVRTEIEQIDSEIMQLIHKRVGMAAKVLEAKKQEKININDPTQNNVVLDRAADAAIELNLDVSAVKEIYNILIRMNIERQQELRGEGNLP
ncbi:MAG: chorismate mutase [Methanolobus sp.]|jgi:chorismate mutase|uniref:Chorismate mutase n=1 Tax=Methanolobus tindarius DSM 2278 TaxID=1090322 RepID=W9DPL3_METTI|nr:MULTISPECIES: chorismate mutase [Methanolobus]ETA67065.1 chorismate mutase [Methanolobus tindarius DSM 2278]MDI3485035.1 chorismate mutase [Methanolobus sp.]MDK2831500.1 chorismate mutase [Methanolobus sp.]MDK2939720.1 chorismate mutase [Methanolobus sp.]